MTTGSFEELQASVLYCSRCRVAQPVRERLLLVLPDGELHEYLCTACGASLGSRRVAGAPVVPAVRVRAGTSSARRRRTSSPGGPGGSRRG